MATKKEEVKGADKKAPEADTEKKAPDIDVEAIKAEIVAQAVAEAQAKARKIVEDAKAEVKAMTDNGDEKPHQETEEEKAYWNEKVPIRLFKDSGKYSDDVTVIHNGKAWLIKRGEKVEVPRKVAMILEQSSIQIGEAAGVMEDYEKTFEAGKNQLTE